MLAVAGALLVLAGLRLRDATPPAHLPSPAPPRDPAPPARAGATTRSPAPEARGTAPAPVPARRGRRRRGTGRRVTRWGLVAVAVCLMFLGLHALEGAVGEEPGHGTTTPPAPSQDATAPRSPAPRSGVASGGPVAPQAEAGGEAAARAAGTAGCEPGAGARVVRPVGRGTAKAVARQWDRIERWLRRRAPRTYATLRPPARAATIALAESQMGVRFPGDLRASLLRHDGVTAGAAAFTVRGARPGSVREIRDDWRRLCGVPTPGTRDRDPARSATPRGTASAPAAPGGARPQPDVAAGDVAAGDVAAGWDGRLIPFAGRAGGGVLVVDSAGGRVGEYAAGAGAYFAGGARWRSPYAMLKATADALEEGTPIGGRAPVVRDGALKWRPAGDTR
ncbi:hypothetical protein Misp01_56940 [Microtetraspora sp. NBRC 13810]|nr:hypothetical protein Misp01_56940 [Microtetraspora sp. NBRC 13810]